jgi:hypothetical protein
MKVMNVAMWNLERNITKNGKARLRKEVAIGIEESLFSKARFGTVIRLNVPENESVNPGLF